MRFTNLAVEGFMGIERAQVALGPCLNILYGPNDLGKSTLARAIRAALLVPPGSSEGARFGPWHADATPRVSLTFVDASARYWKVSKAFGDNHAAELRHSNDGTAFAVDCTGRQVEEKLRALLAWGIPAPGGQGAPRGLPKSFLANALLSAQTDVDAILGASLADDVDASGKVQLTKALATLAQHPLLKGVLDEAQREVATCFTPTGQQKRGRGSKFEEKSRAIKELEAERILLQRQETESSGIEHAVEGLRERRVQAIAGIAEATSLLTEVRERLARTRRREVAQALVEAARKGMAEVVAHAGRVTALETALATLASEAGAREAKLQMAIAECIASDAAVRRAEEAHRSATSEAGARERELREAQLVAQAATLSAKKQEVEGRRSTLEMAVKLRATADQARRAAVAAHAEAENAARRLDGARERTAKLEHEGEVAQALVAYGRWQAVMSATEDAARETAAAAAQRAKADAKDSEAAALEVRAGAIEEEVSGRALLLPAEPEAAALLRLEHDLAMAEAALGGGISVTVHPRSRVAVRVLADHATVIDEPDLSSDRTVEAERRVRLSVGELVDIEVSAGGEEQRRAADATRMRWNADVLPVLKRAGVKSLAEVTAARAEVSKERLAAAELRKSAEIARAEAVSLRDRAVEHAERAAKLTPSPGEVDARSAAIGETPRDVLATEVAKLGKSWEPQAEAMQARVNKELKTAQAEAAMCEQGAKLAEYRAAQADKAVADAASAVAALSGLASSDADGLLKAVVDELAALSRGQAEVGSEIAALGSQASTEVQKAVQGLTDATERRRLAGEAREMAVTALEGARAELNARTGEHRALAAQLEAMNREGATALVVQREKELAAIPGGPVTSDADVEAAERRLDRANREHDEAKEELHKGEGALSKVGGAALREEVGRLDEALAQANAREQELVVDANAWKLLLETLRQVENEEGAHLGRALAGPVTTRFAELTSGRYANLRLAATLKAEGVDVSGGGAQGADVLSALSVGTRNQLATLIRLAIADQLKSAIILDDHLVNSDPTRLDWFRDVLLKTAVNAQVIILTCRPEDYLRKDELPAGDPARILAGGAIRAIDVARIVARYEGTAASGPREHEAGRA